MLLASVIIDVSSRAIKHAFDYEVPSFLEGSVKIGCAVSVEFGSRAAVGYIVGLHEQGDCSCDSAGGAVGAGSGAAGTDGCSGALGNGADVITSSGEGSRADGGAVNDNGADDGGAPRLFSLEDVPKAKTKAEVKAKKDIKLKPVLGVLSEPYFDEISAKLTFWIADEYLCPLPDALRLFTPPGSTPKIKRVDGEWQLVHPGVGAIDDRWVSCTEAAADFVPAKNATKQIAVLQALSEGGMRVAELSAELGAVNSTINALEKKGVLVIESRRRFRQVAGGIKPTDGQLKTLTKGQQNALDAILAVPNGGLPSSEHASSEHASSEHASSECASSGDANLEHASSEHVIVVDGITGSGKTEVYLRAIAACLEQGKTAIVLVPEITLTPQTVGRFRARFGDMVAVLHSRLSLGERFDQWDLARQQKVQVVVGTRSALFAPLSNIGLIIIDEEHDSSYKQDSGARYSARDVAAQMCRMRGATLVLGSATPDIVTLARCKDAGADQLQCDQSGVRHNKTWQRVCLPQRPNKKPLPPVQVIDLAEQFRNGSSSMFGKELVEALQQVYERQEKAVLLFNRRGFASFLLCRECGFTPQCPNCAVNLTYHEYDQTIMCHYCGHQEPAPARCPSCSSPYLRKLGAGTQKVETELKAIVPAGMRIIRMDADTTKKKGAHEALLEQFGAPGPAILLGTQMVAKGLDYPDVTLVGVLNADTSLKLPDFRAAERTYQLIEQVAGRAGRANKPGRVIVQTYMPMHPAIMAAAAHKRELFLNGELSARRELNYPPFSRLANILFWSVDEDCARREATKLHLAICSACESAGVNWEVLDPSPCLLSRLQNKYRWHILIKAPICAGGDGDCECQGDAGGINFSSVLAPVLAKCHKDKRVRMAVDVDPLSLF